MTVISIILICVAAGIVGLNIIINRPIRYGISLAQAKKIVNENEYYYIVKEDGGIGLEFFVTYGSDESFEVELKGNTPLKYLSLIFFYSKKNTFLIKGRICDEQYIGNTLFGEYGEDMLPYIEVESWEIITPIGRDYTYEKNERLIYPTSYLDKYDVDHGDYVPEGK